MYSATATINMSKTRWGEPVGRGRRLYGIEKRDRYWEEEEVIHTSRWVLYRESAYIKGWRQGRAWG